MHAAHMMADNPERIAKVMAAAGLCSRREAERWIEAGRVKVNGVVLSSAACTVGADDTVEVDGTPLAAQEETRLWLYHKPAGLLTTHSDPQGRPTVFEHLPAGMPRVISVGRLDMTSEGLLLLTNSGELARYLELPATGWTRRYRVRVFGKPDERALAKLRKGVTIEGIHYAPAVIEKERETASHSWLTFTLTEGKNREIRKLCEYIGLKVTRLIRTAYGDFTLGKLPPGEVTEIPARKWRNLTGNVIK